MWQCKSWLFVSILWPYVTFHLPHYSAVTSWPLTFEWQTAPKNALDNQDKDSDDSLLHSLHQLCIYHRGVRGGSAFHMLPHHLMYFFLQSCKYLWVLRCLRSGSISLVNSRMNRGIKAQGHIYGGCIYHFYVWHFLSNLHFVYFQLVYLTFYNLHKM